MINNKLTVTNQGMSEEVGTAMVLTIETAAGVGPGVVELKMGQRSFHAATHTPNTRQKYSMRGRGRYVPGVGSTNGTSCTSSANTAAKPATNEQS